jgi:alcohol dehydrogenase
MMKAAVYEAFNGPIKVKSISKPKLISDSSVIISVMAAGVCRSDWHGWKGHDDDIKQHGLPFTPGHEFSGIVVEKGAAVQKLKVGDFVAVPFILSCGHCAECNLDKSTVCLEQSQPGFTMAGSFAEFVQITRADRNLRVLPKGVSFVEAAALGCRFTTAFRAVVQQGLRIENISEVILHSKTAILSPSKQKARRIKMCIFGCGGLGLSCIMIAKALKDSLNSGDINIQSIIAVDVSSEALELSIQLGADGAVNVEDCNNDNDIVRKKIYELTDGLGADITIDAAGFADTCENAIHTCRRGGRMVQVGLPIGGRPPQIPMGTVAGRELEIVGSHGFSATDLPDILRLVGNGKLPVKKLVGNEVNLEEGVELLMAMDKKSPLGMTIITKFDSSSRL